MHQTPDYDSKKSIQNAPEMWMNEIEFIEKTLIELSKKNKCLNILEWGSGNSTIYFSKFLKQKKIHFKWIAVEHFIPWYEKVIGMFKENGLSKNVECVLVNPTLETDKNIQETLDLSDYIHFPTTTSLKFHFILVDGRKRAECLEQASKSVTSDGVVVLHDAEREWFQSGFKYYASGEFVTANPTPAAWGGVQKLWVGRILK